MECFRVIAHLATVFTLVLVDDDDDNADDYDDDNGDDDDEFDVGRRNVFTQLHA